jgi:hypothetical protein
MTLNLRHTAKENIPVRYDGNSFRFGSKLYGGFKKPDRQFFSRNRIVLNRHRGVSEE